MSEFPLLSGLLSVSLLVSIVFFYYSVRRRDQRGVTPLCLMFVGITLWILSDLIQMHTGPDPMAFGGILVRFLGTELTVVGTLLFALEYTGRKRYVRPSVLGLLSIKPLLMVGLTLSPYRDLLFGVNTAVDNAAYPWGYELVRTPLFVGHAAYSWLLVFAGIGLIANMMIRASYAYHRQITAILVALSVPLSLNVVFVLGLIPYDLTASSFLVTATVFMFATFRLRFMDALPVARQSVFEEMDEMVIVLDETGRIITVNEAVRERFDGGDAYVGTDAAELLGADSLADIRNDGDQLPVTIDGERRYLSVRDSTLEDYRGNIIAEVFVCRDVTDQRRRERELRRREEELELLKDLQSRFLRHNLRNELNVMRSNAQLVLDEDDPQQRELQDTIHERTDQILDWSTKARTIERLLGLEETVEWDLQSLVDEVVADVLDTHPDVRIETSLEPGLTVEALPQLSAAVENVVDNAARYNPTDEAHVRITAERTATGAELRVADNGPGIDSAELEAIRSGEERPLQHGTGLGLWLVYWVVQKSEGTLSFDTGEDGTTVTIRLPAPREERSRRQESLS